MATGQTRIDPMMLQLLMRGRQAPAQTQLGRAAQNLAGGVQMAMLGRNMKAEQAAAQERADAARQQIAAILGGGGGTPIDPGASPMAAGPGPAVGGAVPDPAAVMPSGGIDRRALIAAVLSNPDLDKSLAGPLMNFALREPPAADEYTLSPGESRYRGGELLASAPARSKLLTPEEEAQEARLRAAGKTSVTFNEASDGVDYGPAPSGMAWARTPDNKVKLQQVKLADGSTALSPVAVPIVGGPEELKRAEAAAKQEKVEQAAENARAQEADQAKFIIEDIDKIFDLQAESSIPVTGLIGSTAAAIPGTPPHNVAALIEGIEANLTLNKLQDLKASTPTGSSGLGQVTERELNILKSQMGSLRQSQDDEQFTRRLNKLRGTFEDVLYGDSGRFKSMSRDRLNNLDVSRLSDEEVLQYNAEMAKRGARGLSGLVKPSDIPGLSNEELEELAK